GPLILLAVVGLLLVLTGAAWAAARWWAWEPRWLGRSRHATAEAGWRTSAALAESRDWVRLGRGARADYTEGTPPNVSPAPARELATDVFTSDPPATLLDPIK